MSSLGPCMQVRTQKAVMRVDDPCPRQTHKARKLLSVQHGTGDSLDSKIDSNDLDFHSRSRKEILFSSEIESNMSLSCSADVDVDGAK